ncbi:MAG: transposase [Desulfobacterales bacterium]|nr:transposase [Desulfobacterales bacterium]MBF0396420.1 transposase [Desulfobacterales bacterium]
MEIMLSHKIKLDPKKKQIEYFSKACGTARFTYNWGLAEWKRQYEEGLNPSGFGLKKEFNAIKEEKFNWVYEVTKYACQQPFINLQTAFNNFFSGTAKYPQFKKKGIHDSFYIGNDQFSIINKKVKIPKLGAVKMCECLGFSGKIMSAVISKAANQWFVSVSVKMDITPATSESQAVVGVDLGVKNLATLSTSEIIEGSKALSKHQNKLRHLQQSLSRKQKGSKNRYKARHKVAKLHYRISCIRQDELHKLTTKLTRDYAVIVIEDLNVKGMMSNDKLSKAISDMGFFEFKRQLNYKSLTSGSLIIEADRWFPSTKKCSKCGEINHEITLADRVYICPKCNLRIDRDLNAAINLKSLAIAV